MDWLAHGHPRIRTLLLRNPIHHLVLTVCEQCSLYMYYFVLHVLPQIYSIFEDLFMSNIMLVLQIYYAFMHTFLLQLLLYNLMLLFIWYVYILTYFFCCFIAFLWPELCYLLLNMRRHATQWTPVFQWCINHEPCTSWVEQQKYEENETYNYSFSYCFLPVDTTTCSYIHNDGNSENSWSTIH